MASHERQEIVPLQDRNGGKPKAAWAGVLSEVGDEVGAEVKEKEEEKEEGVEAGAKSVAPAKTNRKEKLKKAKNGEKNGVSSDQGAAGAHFEPAATNAKEEGGNEGDLRKIGSGIAAIALADDRPGEASGVDEKQAEDETLTQTVDDILKAAGKAMAVKGIPGKQTEEKSKGFDEEGERENQNGSSMDVEAAGDAVEQWPSWNGDTAEQPSGLMASDGTMTELDGQVIDLQGGGGEAGGEEEGQDEAGAATEDNAAKESAPERWDDIPINRKREGEEGAAKQGGLRAFPLLNQDEELCVDSDEHFSRLLACHPDLGIKVVSIFGNTGKQYCAGIMLRIREAPVFETSDKQDSCTAGAWAALDTSSRAIVIDTEGLLAVSPNEHSRLRLLLKVLALSDVVVYCTKAERLHQDMFHFLKEASDAYCKYFDAELKKAAQSLGASTASVGPSLIIFHQTQNTQPLGAECHEELMPRFAVPGGCFPAAYSDVRYIGSRQQGGVTDFGPLQAMVRNRLEQVSVRLHRPLRVVHSQLAALNAKFAGQIQTPNYGALPDFFFRCPHQCLSCTSQCVETVGHMGEHTPHRVAGLCTYSARYDNIEYVCQACIKKGTRNVVTEAECRTMGLAWGSKWSCQDCGVVYSASYIGGNERDKIERLRPDYCHVWVDAPRQDVQSGNTARMAIEKVMQVAATVAADEEITHCRACGKDLQTASASGDSRKHHCRACGHGFCAACTPSSAPIDCDPAGMPEEQIQQPPVWQAAVQATAVEAVEAVREAQKPNMPRRGVEILVGAGTFVQDRIADYSRAVADLAAPDYWEKDSGHMECVACSLQLTDAVPDGVDGPDGQRRKHHCRACGRLVCWQCSSARRKVPSRGWMEEVRVCDLCAPKPDPL